MTIKCALSGDNHTNTPGRVAEARRVHEWMLEDWKRRGVDFIGFAGDWNEVPPDEEQQRWSRGYIGRCADHAPLIIVPGNHDPEGSLEEFASVHEHKYPVHVITRPDVIRVDTAAGPLAVVCIPFVWKAHLLAQAGAMSVEDSDTRATQLLNEIMLGLGAQVRELGLPTVALIHGKWRGSKLNEEQPNRPLGMEIPIESIGALNADVVCVSHVHLAQSTTFNDVPIFTSSSPFYVDYGEGRYNEKGYVFVELES